MPVFPSLERSPFTIVSLLVGVVRKQRGGGGDSWADLISRRMKRALLPYRQATVEEEREEEGEGDNLERTAVFCTRKIGTFFCAL